MNRELRNRRPAEIVHTPSRFRNPIAKYRLSRSNECTGCGKSVETSPHNVHEM
ncbi:MAG: hypothetical protein PHS17_02670 [Desulfobacterales bacterium]|nr:hypothetical protein [Desulfobacterales bacterium]